MNDIDQKTVSDIEQASSSENNSETNELKKCSQELVKVTTEYTNFKKHIEADFANFKRRVEKERTEWMAVAQTAVLSTILPFVDEFERAVIAGRSNKFLEENTESKTWISGFELLSKNLIKALDSLGVAEIKTDGSFDPELHEALTQVDSSEHNSGAIVQVFSKGYTFKGSVIRHARVSVAK